MALDPLSDYLKEDQPQTAPKVPAPAPPAADPTVLSAEDLVQARIDRRRQAMQTNLYTVGAVQPDARARAMKIAKDLGVDASIVERNLAEAERTAKQKNIPFDAIQRQSPNLAAWLGEEQDHAAVAQDDLENLGVIDWLLTAPQRAVQQGIDTIRVGQLRSKSLFTPLSQAEQDQLNASKFHMDNGGDLGAGSSWFRSAVTGTGRLLPNIAAGTAYGLKYGIPAAVAGGTTAAVLGQLGPQAALPEELVTVPTMFGAGLRAGTIAGGLQFGFELESGLALDEMLSDPSLRDSNGQPLDWNVAKMAAIVTGAINSPLEAFQLEKALELVGAKQLGKAGTRAAVRRALSSATVRAGLVDIAKRYTGNLLEESGTEAVQRAVTVVAEEVAKQQSGQDIPRRTAAQVRTEVGQEFTGALSSFALLGAGGVATQAGQVQADVKRANASRDYYTALGTGMAGSKAAQRAPAAVEKLATRALKDGPIEHSYVDTDTWTKYWQDKGIDPAEMAAEVTGREDALQRATDGQTKLEIPTARYAVTIAPTEHNAFFADELRLGDPDAMNAREDDLLAQESLQAEEPPAPEPGQAPANPLEQMAAALAQKFEDEGRFSPGAARAQAALWKNSVGQMAADLGVDPIQAIERYGLTVARQLEADKQRAVARQDRVVAPTEPGATPAELPLEEGAGSVPRGTTEQPSAATGSTLTPGAESAQTVNPTDASPAATATPQPGAQQAETAPRSGSNPPGSVPESRPSAKENEPHRIKGRKGEKPGALDARRKQAVSQAFDERRAAHVEELFQFVLAHAPADVDEAALRQEFEFRLNLWEESTADYRDSGQDPMDLLRAIARHGGIGVEAHGGLSGERRWLMENTVAGRFAGIQLFARKGKNDRGVTVKGLPFDEMVTALRQDARFHWIESTDDLIQAIDEAMRNPALNTEGILPGSEELTDLGIDISKPWWERNFSGAFTVEEASAAELEAAAAEGDITFNPHEFESEFGKTLNQMQQGLGLEAAETSVAGIPAEIMETRRWSDVETWLKGQAADTGKTLEEVAQKHQLPATEQAFIQWIWPALPADDAHDAITTLKPGTTVVYNGETLEVLGQGKSGTAAVKGGYVHLAKPGTTTGELLSVKSAGLIKAFQEGRLTIVDTLDTGEQQARLPGAENVRDQDIATPELEAPFALTSEVSKAKKGTQTTLFQSAYHGTPHEFDEFSLEAIGTGEGAQAYGWGLYFASNREVAELYRRNLTGQSHRAMSPSLSLAGTDLFDPEIGLYYSKWTRDNGTLIATSEGQDRQVQRGILELHPRITIYKPGPEVIGRVREDLEASVATLTDRKDQYAAELARLQEARIKPGLTFEEETELIRQQNQETEHWRDSVQQLENVISGIHVLDAYPELAYEQPPKLGRTFTVDLNVHEDELLDWDKPYNEQSERVLRALELGGVERPSRGRAYQASLNNLVADMLTALKDDGATELERTEAASMLKDLADMEAPISATEGAIEAYKHFHALVDKRLGGSMSFQVSARLHDIVRYGFDQRYIESQAEELAQPDIDERVERVMDQIDNVEEFRVVAGEDEDYPFDVVDGTGYVIDSYSDQAEAEADRDEQNEEMVDRVQREVATDIRNGLDMAPYERRVRESLGLDPDSKTASELPRNDTGEGVYNQLARKMGDPEQASRYLAALGINGVRYLDGFSRGEGAGTHNYVMFDDQLIKVIEYDQPTRGSIDTPAFRSWFKNSQVTDANGEPLVVFHGANRLDRFGPILRKSRATSGPMPFFTSDREIASSYATKKADTSLADADNQYEAWFRFNIGRTKVNIDRAWYFLTQEQRARIAALAPQVTTDREGSGTILLEEGNTTGTGGYDQHIKETRGNHLHALVEEWLNSGNLFGDEREFMKVLELAGVPTGLIDFDPPHKEQSGVFAGYLAIQKPLVTNAMPADVLQALEDRSRKVRKPRLRLEAGADPWDKRLRDPKEWIQQLKTDLDVGGNSHVWTSIPDWVTETLEGLGYDGIHDTGGKMGGVGHDVWIPFDPTQVKSAMGNRGTYDPTSANTLKQPRRGAITFDTARRQFQITLFENADLSTFLHESGHFFLEMFADFADQAAAIPEAERTAGQTRLLDNWAAALEQLGVPDRAGIGRAQHEQWAASFEDYLRQGKAPNEELRSIFATFRNWLVGIYKALKITNAKLTPELERVFDRMLASDEAIASAERAAQIRPLFLTAEEAGMSPERFAVYQETLQRAHQRAVQKLDSQLLAEVAEEQSATWKGRRDDIKAEVTADVHQRPVYRALALIRRGTHPDGSPLVDGFKPEPMKLSKVAIVAEWGTERLALLPPFSYVTEGGLPPEVIADLAGFSSADEMLTALSQASPMAKSINQETDARMLAEHGSMLLSGELFDSAKEAVTDQDRKVILREEIRALAAKRREVAPFVAQQRQEGRQAVQQERARTQGVQAQLTAANAARRGGAATIRGAVPNLTVVVEAAHEFIARDQVKNIRPSLYWDAMRKAGKRALEAAARGDYDTAIKARTDELTAMARFEAAEQALKDVEARVKRARDLAKPAVQSRIGKASPADLAQINSILDRFDFARVRPKDVAPMEKYIAALTGDGHPIEGLPTIVQDNTRRQHYRDLSYAELQGVSDGLEQIAHQARLRGKLLAAAKNASFTAVRDAVLEQIRSRPLVSKALEFTPADDRKLSASRLYAGHLKLAALAEIIDGQRYGTLWQNLIRPLNAASDQEQVRKTAAYEQLQTIFSRYFPGKNGVTSLARLTDKVDIVGVGSLSREAILSVALNWGNETSRQRLLSDPTRNWNQAHVAAILEKVEAHEWQFVQAIWDHLDSYWSDIAAKQERITGLKPEKVASAPVVTKYGELKGGYYPLVYDGRLAARAFAHEVANEAKLQQMGAYMRATTRRGHTEARQRNVHLSVKLELGVINGHLDQVIHDLTHHETLIDVNRLMKDTKVADAMYRHAGPAVYQQFVEGFSAIAGGIQSDRNVSNKAFAFIRSGTQLALLGWNLWTSLQQPLGLFNGAEVVGSKWVAKGMLRWFRDTATMDNTVAWIASASPFMATRRENANQDIEQLRQTLGQEGSYFSKAVRTLSGDRLTQQTILESFLWHIAMAQRVADVPTWLGQYEKSMAAGHDEATAIAHADQAVIDSQGSGLMKDLSNVQRGNAITKLFLTFYSYGATTINRAAVIMERTKFSSASSVGKGVGDLGLVYVFPALATVALANAVGRRNDLDDDEGALWGLFKAIAGESIGAALNGIVLVRELAGAGKLALGLDPGQRGYDGPAGTRAIALIYRLAGQINQGEVDEALVKAANQVAGVLIGYPSQQLERTVEGAAALAEGSTQNPLVLLFGPERQAK